MTKDDIDDAIFTITSYISPISMQHVAVSSGTGERDLGKLNEILSQVPINFICLDVANGYSEHFVEFVKKVRTAYPHKTIIAGLTVCFN